MKDCTNHKPKEHCNKLVKNKMLFKILLIKPQRINEELFSLYLTPDNVYCLEGHD